MTFGLSRIGTRGGAAPPVEERFAHAAPSATTATAAADQAPSAPVPAQRLDIDTINPPWTIDGGRQIVRVEVVKIGYAAFARCLREAELARARDRGDSVQKYLQRSVCKAAWRAYDATGQVVPLTDQVYLSMPRRYSIGLNTLMSVTNVDPEGEVLLDGDGIDTPIHIRLGTALDLGHGTQVTELEFVGQTLGDIEDVLVAPNEVEQAMALIRRARPVDGGLLTLTREAIDQITMMDGAFVQQRVLPRFFE
jgi:hypothetical protein